MRLLPVAYASRPLRVPRARCMRLEAAACAWRPLHARPYLVRKKHTEIIVVYDLRYPLWCISYKGVIAPVTRRQQQARRRPKMTN